MHLAGLGHERLDGLNVWECFHAEFAVEASTERFEYLVFLLRTVPHVPLVHIADGRVGCDLPVSPWTAGMVDGGGGFIMDGVGEQFLVNVARWEVGLEPGLRVLVCEIVFQTGLLLDLVVLVVAGPEDDGCMMAHAADVRDNLFLHRVKE